MMRSVLRSFAGTSLNNRNNRVVTVRVYEQLG